MSCNFFFFFERWQVIIQHRQHSRQSPVLVLVHTETSWLRHRRACVRECELFSFQEKYIMQQALCKHRVFGRFSWGFVPPSTRLHRACFSAGSGEEQLFGVCRLLQYSLLPQSCRKLLAPHNRKPVVFSSL